MLQMCKIVDKSQHIPVDQWDTEEYPIDEKDRIFRSIRGEIIIPISDLFFGGNQDYQALNYFAMNTKRSYNSTVTREHICRYLNYFEAFYDRDKELLMLIYQIKYNIDYERKYTIGHFMDDVNRYIIRNPNITHKVTHFVDDNYLMKLSSNNNRTPNLQFNNEHAKILYEISLLMNMYISLATHYMYVHSIKASPDIHKFMLKLFDMCIIKYEQERDIYIYNKIYETALSVVNKSKNPDKQLWEKNLVRGNNTTTHTKDSVHDIILQIMPKYDYKNNIINFNYYSNRQCLKFKITDIEYEFSLCKLSSSERDADNNSEYDRYEAKLNKKDEGLALQNKVTAEQTVKQIELAYGPITQGEIEHYRKALTKDGAPVINSFQHIMVNYLYGKDFGDPITTNAIHNSDDYIKLIIAGKRMLIKMGMKILPYVISSRVTRLATRKVINKKDIIKIENDEQYAAIQKKYNNPKIEQFIKDTIGLMLSSSFEIIDYENGVPTMLDGEPLPLVNDIVSQEALYFIAMI